MREYIVGTDEHEGHWLTGEEIVRCGNCRHYDSELRECHKHDINTEYVHNDHFCAWGELKDDTK